MILGRDVYIRNSRGLLIVDGFNPTAKYLSNWIVSPSRDEKPKYLKPPPRLSFSWSLTSRDILVYQV